MSDLGIYLLIEALLEGDRAQAVAEARVTMDKQLAARSKKLIKFLLQYKR